jgi:ligand-binding sensor protein
MLGWIFFGTEGVGDLKNYTPFCFFCSSRPKYID